jgi:hypothetical protein
MRDLKVRTEVTTRILTCDAVSNGEELTLYVPSVLVLHIVSTGDEVPTFRRS